MRAPHARGTFDLPIALLAVASDRTVIDTGALAVIAGRAYFLSDHYTVREGYFITDMIGKTGLTAGCFSGESPKRAGRSEPSPLLALGGVTSWGVEASAPRREEERIVSVDGTVEAEGVGARVESKALVQ